jgi:hypothetical protein
LAKADCRIDTFDECGSESSLPNLLKKTGSCDGASQELGPLLAPIFGAYCCLRHKTMWEKRYVPAALTAFYTILLSVHHHPNWGIIVTAAAQKKRKRKRKKKKRAH